MRCDLKGQFSTKSKVRIFPLTCVAIYKCSVARKSTTQEEKEEVQLLDAKSRNLYFISVFIVMMINSNPGRIPRRRNVQKQTPQKYVYLFLNYRSAIRGGK